MAEAKNAKESKDGGTAKSGSKKMLILVLLAVVVAAALAGGVTWFLLRSKPPAAAHAKPVAEEKHEEESTPVFQQLEPIVVNLGTDLTNSEAANMLIYPRDIIQISRAGVIYVLGAFKQQGSLPLDQSMPLTLLQVAALSGGIGYEGRYDDLRLIRAAF